MANIKASTEESMRRMLARWKLDNPEGVHKLFTPRNRALLATYITIGIDMLGSALTVPVMPFFVESLGGDASTLGLLFSTFAICQMLATSWMGALSDKIGRRPIMLISLGGSLIGMFASSVAPSIPYLFVARAFLGSLSGSMSAATAYIAEITTPAERPRLMSMTGIIMSLSFMFGPGVGAGLSQLNIRAPFWVGSFTSFLAFVVAFFNIRPPSELELVDPALAKTSEEPEPLPPADKKETSNGSTKEESVPSEKPSAATTNWPLIWLTGSASLLTNFAMSSAMTCGALFLQDVFGYGSLQFGFVMMGSSVWSIIVRAVIFNPVQERYGLMQCAAVGAVLSASQYLGYALAPATVPTGFALYLLAMSLGTIGSTFTSGSVSPFLSTLAAKENLGRVMSIPSLASSAGRMAGPPLFGLLYVHNNRWAYEVASVACLAACGVFVAVLAATGGLLPAARPSVSLAKQDSAKSKPNKPLWGSGLDRAQESTIKAAQAELRDILIDRGYMLKSAESRMYIVAILDNAFPRVGENEEEEALLAREVHHLAHHSHEDHHAHHA